MINLPNLVPVDPSRAGPSSSSSSGGANRLPPHLQSATVDQLLLLLPDRQYQDDAVSLLNVKRTTSGDLALSLWYSVGSIFVLLREIIATYRFLTPSKLTRADSTRVCDIIALLQCVAGHPETRMPFVNARIPQYLFPFLSMTENELPFDYLRLSSLSVIGSLVKADDPQITVFLLGSEIIPLCLRCMEFGSEMAKIVATFIVSRILMQEEGLEYCCSLPERFYVVVQVLGGMVEKLDENSSLRLLKEIICCLRRLSDMPRACNALKRCLPPRLADPTLLHMLSGDTVAVTCLQQLLCRTS